jgi:hypothetical protein
MMLFLVPAAAERQDRTVTAPTADMSARVLQDIMPAAAAEVPEEGQLAGQGQGSMERLEETIPREAVEDRAA